MRHPARTATTLATFAVLALGLTACGDDPESATPAAPTVTVTEAPAGSETGSDAPAGRTRDREQSGSPAALAPAALAAAARTALGAAEGTLVGLDQQVDGTWEADVVAQDGAETSLQIAADGAEVLDQRPDNDDAEDLAENQQLLGTSLDWSAAVEGGSGELTGPVTEIDLGEDDGRIVWEVGTEGDGPGTDVTLDAQTGDVLASDDD